MSWAWAHRIGTLGLALALALARPLGAAQVHAAAHSTPVSDLLVTAAKPDQLFIIDAAARAVRAQHQVAGANGQIFTIVLSPDQRIAYLLVDRMERIVGIDLGNGR